MTRWHYPNALETVLGKMIQKRKNIRSTKKQLTKDNKSNQPNLTAKINKSEDAHFFIRHCSKMCSDQTGKFPYIARSGNKYILIACVVDTNLSW